MSDGLKSVSELARDHRRAELLGIIQADAYEYKPERGTFDANVMRLSIAIEMIIDLEDRLAA